MPTEKTIFDKLAEKADELELQRKAEEFVDAATKAAHAAVEKVGAYTHENREKVEGLLDKAAAKVDESTDGKYADKVAKARTQASKGVAKLAEQRPTTTDPTGESSTAPVTAPVTTSASEPVTAEPWSQATDPTTPTSRGSEADPGI